MSCALIYFPGGTEGIALNPIPGTSPYHMPCILYAVSSPKEFGIYAMTNGILCENIMEFQS